jgi:hypothetical protein
MQTLPKDVDVEILYKLKWPDNVNLCKTNRRLAQVCNDKKIWRNLMKRDFPKYYYHINPELSTRVAYDQIWKLLNEAADGLMRNYHWVNPRYARLNVMKEDIIEELKSTIEYYAKTKDIPEEEWNNLSDYIIIILTGLDRDSIGDEPEQLDISDIVGIGYTTEVRDLFYYLGYSKEGEKFKKPEALKKYGKINEEEMKRKMKMNKSINF